jgi:hypothetical protein
MNNIAFFQFAFLKSKIERGLNEVKPRLRVELKMKD